MNCIVFHYNNAFGDDLSASMTITLSSAFNLVYFFVFRVLFAFYNNKLYLSYLNVINKEVRYLKKKQNLKFHQLVDIVAVI